MSVEQSNEEPPVWSVVALLWPVALLNYLDRQMIATMGLSIKHDIVELQSAEKYGQLMAVFMWVYAICSPLSGAIADRFNRKRLIVVSLAVWSTVTLMMGHVNGFSELYWLRAIMGVSEAIYIPAGLALIADYHPGSTRSLAIGAHMSGVYMGQALGGVAGWVAQDISWRAAFSGCGYVGVFYSLVLAIFLREKKRDAPPPPTELSAASPARGVVNSLGLIILILCFSLPSLPGWAVKNWLPTLLQDRFELNQKTSGLWATVIYASAAFCGVWIGGRVSDVWSRRNVLGRTWTSGLGLLLSVPALIGIGLAPSFALAIASTALYGFGFGVFDANNMPILCQICPPRFRSTAYGLMNFAGISAGAYLTPLLGKLKDNDVPLSIGFALCAIPAAFAGVLMFFLRPKMRDCQNS